MTIETWGKNRRALRGKASKLDIIHEIGEAVHAKQLDIGNLSIKDLNIILKAAKEHRQFTGDVPNSRNKQPYIDCLMQIIPNVSKLDRLSVSSLQSLVKAFRQG